MEREQVLRELIDKYEERIKTMQTFVNELKQELGGSLPSETQAPGSGQIGVTIARGELFGKSYPEAAKMVLEKAHYPMTTAEIMEALEKGGVDIGGKNKHQNLYTRLWRSGLFGVKKGKWGIKGWPGFTKNKKTNGGEESETDAESAEDS